LSGCLVPFDAREAITLKVAAAIAGKSEGTIKNWCLNHGIGRRIGGVWAVSRVALAMFLDGDHRALAAYLGGDREGRLVVIYFERAGLRRGAATMLAQPTKSAKSAISAISA
jgi:hypothetical protein